MTNSHYALNMVSEALRKVLGKAIHTVPAVSAYAGGERSVVSGSPAEAIKDSSHVLSLWLYRITENQLLRNNPAEQHHSDRHQYPPLLLELHYLITPLTGVAESDEIILGWAMRVLHDNPVIYLVDPASGLIDEIRVVLCQPDQSEHTGIWESLHVPYRTSLTYLVRVVRIDSTRVDPVHQVVEVETTYSTRGTPHAQPGGARETHRFFYRQRPRKPI